ncbi:MAG: hypothetical protein GY937_16115 [bacterium]|nr:hypothetical protein [bacterium]
METLRRLPGLLTLRSEINTFLRLSGLDAAASGTDSDRLTRAHANGAAARRLERLLWDEVGEPTDRLDCARDADRFVRDVVRRILMQWPSEQLRSDRLEAWVHEVLATLCRDHGWKRDRFYDGTLFHALLLRRMRRSLPRVHPFYYDLGLRSLRSFFPDLAPAEGPPSPWIVEEPPFVAVRPHRPPTEDELSRLPLVLT